METRARSTEQTILKEEQEQRNSEKIRITDSQLVIDGRVVHIENNVNDLGRALYLAVQSRQWPVVETLLQQYRLLPGHDVLLVHYASGGLARSRGQLEQAEQTYRKLLELQPDFILAQLELARVLFENHSNPEAIALFAKIKNNLPRNSLQANKVSKTIKAYLDALDFRDSWQGSFALGPIYSDNINQSSESETCLRRLPNGVCFIERKTPEAISASGMEYEATLSKRKSLTKQHGIQLRSLVFGKNYQHQSRFNEATLLTRLGYSYQNAKDRIFLAPLFEYKALGNMSLLHSWGLGAEWMHNLSNRTAVKLEADYREQRYRSDRHSFQNGGMLTTHASIFHQYAPNTMLFGGTSYTYKKNKEAVHAYKLHGLRFGVSKPLISDLNATFVTSFRVRKFQALNAPLGKQRRDMEQNYSLILAAPRLQFWTLTPNLTLKHSKVKSNIDWLYSYKSNEISLKFEKRF
ncbi:surface lipoprotein assembly modifier [Endozoicomonadaceae bacterium StTr2]